MGTCYSFPKSARLLTRHEYRHVAKHGREFEGNCLAVKIYFGKSNGSKIGISVPKRFGKAVKRNRFKRLVREAFRLNREKIAPNVQLSVRPNRHVHPVRFQEVQEQLIALCELGFSKDSILKRPPKAFHNH